MGLSWKLIAPCGSPRPFPRGFCESLGGRKESGVGYYILMVTLMCEEQSICSKFQDAFQAMVISSSSFFSPSLLFPSFPTCYCDEFWLPLDHGQLMDCVIISNSGCLHLHSTCEFHSLSQLIHSHNTPTPLSPSAHTDVFILWHEMFLFLFECSEEFPSWLSLNESD